jgi:hypothetical protein
MSHLEDKDQITIKSAQSRFIMLTEECKNNLSHYELAVFVTLLFEANYSQKQSEVKMSIKQLSILSKMGERKVYECLNALEHIHFVLKRTNYEKMKYGHENCYLIARDYLYFKQIDKEFITPAPKDMGVQSLITPAPKDSTPCREKTVPPAQKDIPIDHSYSVIIKETSSTFFNEMQIQRILRIRREARNLEEVEDDEFLIICETHVKTETPKNKNFNKAQRIVGLCKMIATGDFEPPQSYVNEKEEAKKKIEQEDRLKAQQEAQERQHRERTANEAAKHALAKENPTSQRRGSPTRLADILNKKT